ncbi:MAG TPA: hypothetical protein VHJ17_02250 [Thermomonospora sp.]|nr:hypothetical protein [Thermomonospora sp.]
MNMGGPPSPGPEDPAEPGAAEESAPETTAPDPPAASQDWSPVTEEEPAPPPRGRHAKPLPSPSQEPVSDETVLKQPVLDEPVAEPPPAVARGLSAEPTAATPREDPAPESEGVPLPGDFLRTFTASVTWRALLVVVDGAFPGQGVTGVLTRRAEELAEAVFLPPGGDPGAPFPVWADDSGLALDLSVHFAGVGVRGLGAGPGRRADDAGWAALNVRSRDTGFRQRHHGVLVVDTLNPQSLYRPFGGPVQPDDEPSGPADTAVLPDGPDAGVVIVADLRRAGNRVVTARSLWRYGCQAMTSALYDPSRPETRAATREELRALRHVAYVDPALGLCLVVQVDAARRPWCPLGFVVEEDAVTGQATARMLWP